MKKFIQATIPVLSIILLAACGSGNSSGETEKKDSASHEGPDHAAMEEGETSGASVQLKEDKASAVYQHYLHLTTALTKGHMEEAKIAGNAIEAGAKQVDGGESVASKVT